MSASKPVVMCCCAMQASATSDTATISPGGEQKKLWGGRFTGKTDPLMEKFNESLPFDKRMWAEDVRVGFLIAQKLTEYMQL